MPPLLLPMQGQRALVIGASGGIGSAIARGLAARGTAVACFGSNQQKLEAVQNCLALGAAHEILACDLLDAASVSALCVPLGDSSQDFDTVVIASGEFNRASVLEADAQMFDRLFAINVRGPYALLRASLAGLIRRRGQVVIVSSTAALKGRPNCAQYCATQASLRSLAESLRDEVNGLEVRVLTVFPGRTATELWKVQAQQRGELYRPELLLQPEDIAESVCAALLLPRTAELTDLHIRPFKKSY